jgi:hypothetical protein
MAVPSVNDALFDGVLIVTLGAVFVFRAVTVIVIWRDDESPPASVTVAVIA